ncbi:MAG: nitroreductase family protein [Patescibacteria group bacterium]|nr:nitroreductase family protein [Patescibacteria group bacterium]MDD5294806.1 nitroreductase family protein [Patescibacteria group bacterium]MDD5554248.1 nitroreductase family protein [Patescibacteria group bacterium]
MKDFLSLVKSRRSVRQYRQEKIPRDQIEKIIEAGTWAPSAFNQQPIKFFVLEDSAKIKLAGEKIREMRKKAGENIWRQELPDPTFYQAPAVIFLCVSEPKNKYALADAALACQNCLLQAREMDLATVVVGQATMLEEIPEVKEKLGLPNNWEILLSFCLGKTDSFPEAPERKKPEVIFK